MNWIEHPKVVELLDWYEKSLPRERLLIEVTLQVAVVFGLFMLLEPVWKDTAANAQKLEQAEIQLSQLEQQVDALQGIQPKDTNRILGQQIYDLMDQSARLEKVTAESVAQLVSPELMVVLLGDLLAKVEGVELLALNNLDPIPLYANSEGKLALDFSSDSAPFVLESNPSETPLAHSGVGASKETSDDSDTAEPILWRHSLNMKFKATYSGMSLYLKQLHALPGHVFWQSMEYRQTEYPWGEVQLEVFTLSQNKEALGV